MMKDQIPTTTVGEWRFFRHIQAKPGTNLIVSAWLWEYHREALTINPRCLDWLWKWREEYASQISAFTEGDPDAFEVLRKSEPAFRVSAWMISPDFPGQSLCEDLIWGRMKLLSEKLPPCGGVDEPHASHVRRRFFPHDDEEIYPVMSEDSVHRGMGVIEKVFLNCDDRIVVLPIEIDLTKSNDFLVESLRLMVEAVRSEFEKISGPIKIKTARGKSSEAARVPAQLKALATLRLLDSLDRDSHAWREAAETASRHGIELYAKTSHKSWFRAKREAQELAKERAEILDDSEDEQFLRDYELGLQAIAARLDEGNELDCHLIPPD